MKKSATPLYQTFGWLPRKTLLAVALGTAVFVSSVSAQNNNPSSSPVEFKDLPVTVEPGDTFSRILSRELKSLDGWGEVARYNKLESPDNLKPGDVIVIPAELLRLRNYATVVFVKGVAQIQSLSDDGVAELKKGDRIYSGDLIKTDEDGFVSVSFNGGTSVNIQPESAMKINVLQCVEPEDACEISLESGEGQLGLDVQSVGFEKPTVFNIVTPYASAAVRGTRFDFDISDGNALGVTEGTVEISINGASNAIDIGKGVLAGAGRSIDELFDLLEEPELALRDDASRVSDEDIINWQSVDDAATYIIAYAPSESMVDAFTSLSLSDTFTKPELPPGEAFISARAVADNGLRGFTSKKKLVSVAIDDRVDAPLLDIVLSENEMEITAPGAPGDTVEVKIGNAIATLEDGVYVVTSQIIEMSGGETATLEVDRSQEWYLQGRNVIDESTVSPYGLLYFYERNGG